MPRWILIRPNCSHRFTHSNIEPTTVQESYRDPFKVVARPKFKDGETMECLNCKVKAVY
jgi:hypothetical protein